MDERIAAAKGETFAAVLVAAEAMRAEAREAVTLAGGRLMAEIGWDEVAARLGREAGRPVLVIEAEGVDAGLIAATLPRIDAVAGALDLQLVVTLSEAEIDVVTAALLGGPAQLLCSPSMAERVSALALAAAARAGELHDRVREHEAERLARLNEEVARIAQVLARLAGSERASLPVPSGDVADRRATFGAPPAAAAKPIDPQMIRRAIRARRMRDSFFDPSLTEDPGWDMLLDLFAAELEGAQVSVSSLCIASAVASTTALRWIGKMTDAGLFERRPDPFDRRRAFMGLAPPASESMRGYVTAVIQAGLAIA